MSWWATARVAWLGHSRWPSSATILRRPPSHSPIRLDLDELLHHHYLWPSSTIGPFLSALNDRLVGQALWWLPSRRPIWLDPETSCCFSPSSTCYLLLRPNQEIRFMFQLASSFWRSRDKSWTINRYLMVLARRIWLLFVGDLCA